MVWEEILLAVPWDQSQHLRTFFEKHHACETAIIEIPQKYGGYTAFEIPITINPLHRSQ